MGSILFGFVLFSPPLICRDILVENECVSFFLVCVPLELTHLYGAACQPCIRYLQSTMLSH